LPSRSADRRNDHAPPPGPGTPAEAVKLMYGGAVGTVVIRPARSGPQSEPQPGPAPGRLFSAAPSTPVGGTSQSQSVQVSDGDVCSSQRSNDGQAILKAARPDLTHTLSWHCGWSYGDSNPGPLACHTRLPGRAMQPPVALYNVDVRRHSADVARGCQAPVHVGSHFGSHKMVRTANDPRQTALMRTNVRAECRGCPCSCPRWVPRGTFGLAPPRSLAAAR
jgi:hypothetical protein